MRSFGKGLAACLVGAALAVGLGLPASAATQVELEQKIKMLEQSLDELKGQLGQVQQTQAQQGEQVAVVASKAAKDSLPKWLERISLFGDLRLRMEHKVTDDFNGKSTDDRTRWRYRLRFGARSQIHEDLQVGLRMASGADDDPTSTNETLTNWFSEKSWGIDQAWATWTPGMLPDRFLSLTAGKINNPFVTTNIMWDSDINPEGAAAMLMFNKKGALKPFITLGAFSVKEQSKDDPGDVYLYAPQVGLKWKQGVCDLTLAASYYDWNRYNKVGNFPTDLRGNVKLANGELPKFKVWDVYGKYSHNFGGSFKASVWGHYMKNSDDDSTGAADGKDTGYDVGVGFDYASFGMTFDYKVIQANATPGFFSDSDFGYNNRKGYVISAKYKIFDYTDAQLTWYHSQAEDEKLTGASAEFDMIHADLVFKF
ncbi:MAG: putative porin [Desulfarculus sp.]|nr:putative porin [Desulfarculus sp.]